jgi:SAM-dependent methyltransferase
MPKLRLSPGNPNQPEQIDSHFVPGGRWEAKGGRQQTTRHAECFLKHVCPPRQGSFSFLDVGCALGDAMPMFRKAFPEATLSGCDISEKAVRRCQEEYGHLARFFQSSVGELTDHYDVIHCSNVIEHVENYVEIVQHLTSLAETLYIMVPYNEHYKGQPLRPDMGFWHIATFDEHTFDSLTSETLRLRYTIYNCRPAWTWKLPLRKLDAWLHRWPYVDEQIAYEFARVAPGADA